MCSTHHLERLIDSSPLLSLFSIPHRGHIALSSLLARVPRVPLTLSSTHAFLFTFCALFPAARSLCASFLLFPSILTLLLVLLLVFLIPSLVLFSSSSSLLCTLHRQLSNSSCSCRRCISCTRFSSSVFLRLCCYCCTSWSLFLTSLLVPSFSPLLGFIPSSFPRLPLCSFLFLVPLPIPPKVCDSVTSTLFVSSPLPVLLVLWSLTTAHFVVFVRLVFTRSSSSSFCCGLVSSSLLFFRAFLHLHLHVSLCPNVLLCLCFLLP